MTLPSKRKKMNSKEPDQQPNDPASLDQTYLWRPFTQMQDWMQVRPVVIASGSGATLVDDQGREYLDCNASIWTNLHGHKRRELDAALKNQIDQISHSSPLGLSNIPAPLLAQKLADSTQNDSVDNRVEGPELKKVFFSDDGSTAMEVALKLSFEATRRRYGKAKPSFISVKNAYHGDTIGAVSAGKVDLFHQSFGPMLFPTETVMSPYCYRCPFNQGTPERTDARLWRRCHWECVSEVESRFDEEKRNNIRTGAAGNDDDGPNSFSTFIVEPIMQGAAGMIAQPEGWLQRVIQIVRDYGAQWIADEVMTGFGRTGPLFAFQKGGVRPDFLALAKGLTGGYLPMAATLTTEEVFEEFLGSYEDFKTFFHGHSYTANQLGAAVGLKSFELLETTHNESHRTKIAGWIREGLRPLWNLPVVGDIRQEGTVVGIELVKDWKTREPFPLEAQAGIRVCNRLKELGVLTRPIGSVLVFMTPYCISEEETRKALEKYAQAIQSELM